MKNKQAIETLRANGWSCETVRHDEKGHVLHYLVKKPNMIGYKGKSPHKFLTMLNRNGWLNN